MKKNSKNSKITRLPDGSACFTGTIMTKAEAMGLPIKMRPICHRISSEMYKAVYESIGMASMCWKPRPKSQVFESERASDIALQLCFKIANEIENRDGSCLETPKKNTCKSNKSVCCSSSCSSNSKKLTKGNK